MKLHNSKIYSMNKTRKLVFMAILVSQALVLNFIERAIPFNFAIPGAKLGLANIVTLTSLYLFSFKETLTIIILRTFLGSFFGGSFSSLLYSISGALLSFFAMYFLVRVAKDNVSTAIVSIIGGITHNLGQLIMAALIIQNANMILYLPFLMLTGIGTGLFVGITVKFLMKYLKVIHYL